MTTYAYARVSARDQNLERQLAAFSEYGVQKNRVFSDKKSGKDFERAAYKRLIKKLKAGDLLVIKSIDRLGRDYVQIMTEWAYVTNTVGADILVLDMPLLDTRTRSETLVGKFISDIVLQVLSFVAQNERENIRARQAEGIKAAIAGGVKFGRPRTSYSEYFLSVAADFMNKRVTAKRAVEMLGMKLDNFYYRIRKLKSNAYAATGKPCAAVAFSPCDFTSTDTRNV